MTDQAASVKTVLLMTATVRPPAGMPGSVRMDSRVRLAEYCDALSFYLALPDSCIQGIVVLENSDADFSPLEEIYTASGSKKNVEFIHTSSDYPPERGKGYGEFMMIDEGMAVSSMLRRAQHIWKVTGRLKVLNMEALVASAPDKYEIYADLRSVPLIGESLGGNHWVDLRVFSFAPAAYDEFFRGQYGSAYVLEKFFFNEIKLRLDRGHAGLCCRFRVQPDLMGFSGHSNNSYQSPSYKIKTMMRSVARRLFPLLWL